MAAQERTRFRDTLEEVSSSPSTAERLQLLKNLAKSELSIVETIQLDRVLQTVAPTEQSSLKHLKLAVLASSTMEHLVPAIRVGGLRRDLFLDVSVGAFGQYRQELIDPESALAAGRPDMILLSMTWSDLLSPSDISMGMDERDRFLSAAVSEMCELWRIIRQQHGAIPIQQSILDVAPTQFGNHDALVPGAPAGLISRFNIAAADAAAAHDTLWLDVARASARDGIDVWFDQGRWLHGKIEISPLAAGRYADLLSRLIGASLGKSKKCLVLDLDNTLWGGVLGDDGPAGIVLGEGSALGEAHLALQKYAKCLSERGVILAVCSKNDWNVVSEVFESHPEMYLRPSDISAFAVNWNDKAENLCVIAEQLNIGLESMVFVDDNPVERARIRDSLESVEVPELPDDPAYYVRIISESGYFESVGLTTEDKERTSLYAANARRKTLQRASQSLDDFLKGLDMVLTFGPVTDVNLLRAGQLINKTNQFNTTTKRMQEQELARFSNQRGNLALQFRLADRFGDNGLVSVMLFAAGEAPGSLELVNWVMSCRVFGRQLEFEAMNIAVEVAKNSGASVFYAQYIPTSKNSVIADLFSSLGFSIENESPDGGSQLYSLKLSDYAPKETCIDREVQLDG